MGVKLNPKTKFYEVSVSARHPITRRPKCLRRVGIKSKSLALRVQKELIIKLDKQLHKHVSPLWRDAVSEFAKHSIERGLRERTIENYVLCLKAHTFDIWRNRSIDSIKTSEITELIKVQLASKSESHKKNMRKYINGVMEYAVSMGYMNSNPTPRLKFRVGDKLTAVLTLQQSKILLEKAKEFDHEWYPHWAMALYTGMRNGELYALTWDKVDIANKQILVSCGWTNKDGYKDFTKSGDDRIVEIADNLVPILKELKLKQSDSIFVLPRIDKWDRGDQARILQAFLLPLGLPLVRFHDLRASWCTMMLSLGVELVKVMKMGGWKDLKVMQRYLRKAGVETKGITKDLKIHNHFTQTAQILSFKQEH